MATYSKRSWNKGKEFKLQIFLTHNNLTHIYLISSIHHLKDYNSCPCFSYKLILFEYVQLLPNCILRKKIWYFSFQYFNEDSLIDFSKPKSFWK